MPARNLSGTDRGDYGQTDAAMARARARGGVGSGLLLVVATVAAYVPAIRCGYVWDDDQYLTDNHLVQTGRGLPAVWALWWDAEAGRLRINTPQYYPLVYTSYWLEHRLWGLRPAGYHVVNVLLHAVSALLVWRIGRRLAIPGAWFVAAAFALHPVHVESVAWITERKNVLSGTFYLLALLAFLRYFALEGKRWYAAGLVLFVAALLSKTVTCTLPIALLLIRWYQGRRGAARYVALVMPLVLIGAAAGLLTVYLERAHVGAEGGEWAQGFLERTLLIAPRAFWFYAGKIAWPHPLIFIYPRWQVEAGAWAAYAWAAALVAAAGGALVGIRRLGRGPLLALLYAGVTLAPALGFFPVYPQRFSWVADHFQYLGSLGFIILYTLAAVRVTRPLARLRAGLLAGRALALVVLVVLGGLTFRRSAVYQSAERLWEDTLRANPGAWIAALNLGHLAAERGRYDRAAEYYERAAEHPVARSEAYNSWGNALLRMGRVEGAIEKFRQSLSVNPQNAKSYAGLAAAYARLGRLDEAERALEQELRLDPERPLAWMNLGLLRGRQQRWPEAEQSLLRAIRLAPHLPEARVVYGNLLAAQKRWGAAVAQYRAAQRERPGASAGGAGSELSVPGWDGQGDRVTSLPALLVTALFESGACEEAVRECNAALARRPNDARLLRALAWMRATCAVDALRDGREALRIAARLAEAAPDDPRVLDALACAHAELGQFEQAVAVGERAREAARAAGETELAQAIEARLELFRAGKPYRHAPS